MPTFCALTGYEPHRHLKWDGANLVPLLTNHVPLPDRPIYTAGPRWRVRSLRYGDWKLIVHGDGEGKRIEALQSLGRSERIDQPCRVRTQARLGTARQIAASRRPRPGRRCAIDVTDFCRPLSARPRAAGRTAGGGRRAFVAVDRLHRHPGQNAGSAKQFPMLLTDWNGRLVRQTLLAEENPTKRDPRPKIGVGSRFPLRRDARRLAAGAIVVTGAVRVTACA